MASKFSVDHDTRGNEVIVVRGWRYDGLAAVFATEREARTYVASRRGIDCWAAFAIIYRPGDRHGRPYHVICRQR